MNPVCVLCVCVFMTKVTFQITGVSADECLFVCVVGAGFDSTFPAFFKSRARQTTGSDGRLVKKRNHTLISGEGIAKTPFCRCLQHSKLVQALSF